MFRLGKWAVAAALAIWMLAAQEAKAGVGFQPVSPDELKMTSEPLAPGAPAIILYRQVDRDDNIHTPHEDNYFRIKILTEEGRKHADVEIPFWKETQNVVNVKARTIRPDGSIADFDGKVFEKDLVKGRFEGRGMKYLAKTFTLPDVQVGSIIEYSYTIDFSEYMLFDSHWILSDELFTKKAQFSLKPFNDSYYGVYSLRWSWQSLPAGSVAPKQGPDRIVRMEASNIPAFQTEDYMPPAERIEVAGGFYLRGGLHRERPGHFLEALREAAERAIGKLCRKAQGDGAGGGANCLAERLAGGETAQDLRPGAADPEHVVRSWKRPSRKKSAQKKRQ